MKLIVKSIRIIASLIAILSIAILVAMYIDKQNASYLSVENNPTFSTDTYIIKNVNIVPMNHDTILRNKTIFIKDGIIKKIADTIQLDNIEIIDGENNYLSPGLIDMHTHLWDQQELGLYLANGVTTVRNLWGYPFHLRIKKDIDEAKIIGPMFFTSSPKLTSKNDLGDDKLQVETPEQAIKLVKQYKERGFDFIKTYAGLEQDIFDAILKQSIQSDITIAVHPSYKIPYLNQFHTQIETLEHAEEIVQQALKYKLDSLKLAPIIQKFVDTKKSFCPTLTGYYKIYEMLTQGEKILESDPIQYINPLIQLVDTKAQYNRWSNEKQQNPSIVKNIEQQHQFHLYILKSMQEAGVNIVCGTDAGIGITTPGYSIHQELALYQEAGLRPYEALKTATINPSKTHKLFHKIGSIEQGKFANFILSKQNPLKNLKTLQSPEWVLVKGKKIDKKTLKKFNTNAANRKTLISTAVWYVEYLFFEK